MKKRSLDVHDYSAGKFFGRLEDFLGAAEIDRRLARIDVELRSETGLYLREWVMPKRAWWLGFREARAIMRRNGSFRRAITPIMERPLQTAAKVSMLHSSMPDWKQHEFRSRILADDVLDPTLFEIDCATHFHVLGYDIEWFELPKVEGVRSPEFIATGNGVQIEVECKAKQADSGRRVERASFYRALDELVPVVHSKGLCGTIILIVPARFPTRASWREEARNALDQQLTDGHTIIALPGGEKFECELRPADGSNVLIQDLATQMAAAEHPYSHFAVTGIRTPHSVIDPLIFRLESAKKDTFLQNVLESLRSAQGQFTGERAALINCMLPEIDSFEGLQADSAVQKMTYLFFDQYARPCINAVTYVSEARREVQGLVISSDMPSLTFRNHKYEPRFGPDVAVYG